MSTITETPKTETQHVNLVHPVDLKAAMQRLAEANHRSLNQEYKVDAERYIHGIGGRKAGTIVKFNPDEPTGAVALVRAVMPSDPTHPLSLESLRRRAEWKIHVDEDNGDAMLARLPEEQEWAYRLGEVYSEEAIIEKLGLGRLQAEAVCRLGDEVADLFQERYEDIEDRMVESQVDDFYVSETDPTGDFSVRHEPS